MFGLRVPLVKSLASTDFDGVHTILYNSGLREPSQWLSKVDDLGRIFELELEDSPEDLPEDKECLCSCSDCATDDTGYGTDTDLHASLRKHDEESRHYHGNAVLTDFNVCDFSSAPRPSFSPSVSNSVGDAGSFQEAEGSIDSLFLSVNIGSGIDLLDMAGDVIPSNIDKYFSTNESSKRGQHQRPNNTVKVAKQQNMSKNGTGKQEHVATEVQKVPRKSERKNSGKCECGARNEKLPKSDICVTLKLRPHHGSVSGVSTVELCEWTLGIVPGHYGNSHQHHRRRDRRVKVRGLIPTGVASKYTDIHVGDCLVSVNERPVTWDNLDTVLHSIVSQRQVRVVVRRSSKQKNKPSMVVSSTRKMVQLVTGSNHGAAPVEDVMQADWEPFYGAMYLSLDGVSSDNMQAKEDIVYQFPRVDNKVIDSRGMFITLAGTVTDATQSTVRSTTLQVDNQPVHVVYHSEGKNLFVVSVPENRLSLPTLTTLVTDLIRLLQVTHCSIHDAFTSPTHRSQLDCFFALLHHCQVSREKISDTVWNDSGSLSQSVKMLTLPNEIKIHVDSVLTEFEAADFGDMSDSYYGCRRAYSVLGSCLFYKTYLVAHHLPKDDLVDFSTYLRYHSLLNLTTDQSLGQLVVWREVYPTRQCHSVAEEQQFGYTEPLIARWYWLIVGYKHMIMCIMLETGGCTKVCDDVSIPDPFLIDQARAVLMQLDGQNVPLNCQNSISNPECPLVTKPDIFYQRQQRKGDLLSRSLKKLPHKESSQLGVIGSFNENHSGLRRLLQKRKESECSDNSSESSAESMFKFSRKGRLFPETTDLLQNMNESKEDIGPVNANRKLAVGVENCLFHFQYYDNLEGVFVSSNQDVSGEGHMNTEILNNFQRCCLQIKAMFDSARKVKEQYKSCRDRVIDLNGDFTAIREEGVMFACPSPNTDKKSQPVCYWVVGRCLSRSLRREVYVCFHESTPQTVVELAFKLAMGYLPL